MRRPKGRPRGGNERYEELAADAMTAVVTGTGRMLRPAVLLEVRREHVHTLGSFPEQGGFNVRRIPGRAVPAEPGREPRDGKVLDVLVVHAGRVPLKEGGPK